MRRSPEVVARERIAEILPGVEVEIVRPPSGLPWAAWVAPDGRRACAYAMTWRGLVREVERMIGR